MNIWILSERHHADEFDWSIPIKTFLNYSEAENYILDNYYAEYYDCETIPGDPIVYSIKLFLDEEHLKYTGQEFYIERHSINLYDPIRIEKEKNAQYHWTVIEPYHDQDFFLTSWSSQGKAEDYVMNCLKRDNITTYNIDKTDDTKIIYYSVGNYYNPKYTIIKTFVWQ